MSTCVIPLDRPSVGAVSQPYASAVQADCLVDTWPLLPARFHSLSVCDLMTRRGICAEDGCGRSVLAGVHQGFQGRNSPCDVVVVLFPSQ